jgi:hypothetical protein
MGISRHVIGKAAELTSDKPLEAGTWIVDPEYSIRSGPNGRYIRAEKPELEPLPINERGEIDLAPDVLPGVIAERARISEERREYQPLAKYDDLFLRFARLADDGVLDDELDTDKNAAVALDWAEDYGVLGLTPAMSPPGAWWGDPRGGVEDTVAAFAFEAWVANATLRLYEAAAVPGGVDVEAIAPFMHIRERGFFTQTPGMARGWALGQVDRNVQYRVARYRCYPHLYRRPVDNRGVEGYDFGTLLGAMWLQAMWLLIAENPLQCRNPKCRRIIAFEQPEQVVQGVKKNDRSKGYSTRSDKEYCSKKCFNAHYYEREIKPRRQAKRARRADNN